ncbi:Transmembrane protein 80 [Cichlidogyrus casuarinus]|uniref:Transmembrane protein 80 n=1 Tax=Cichlidogyrus casuarinus TaxID=1844966 RepID=A0ABD2Q6N3_9PLAT
MIELSLMIYKSINYPYPSSVLAGEFIGLLLLFILKEVQASLGLYANLSEKVQLLIITFFLSLLAILPNVWLLIWQTYTMRIELIFIGIALGTELIQLIATIISMINSAQEM